MISDDLLADLEDALGKSVTSVLTNRDSVSDIFEAYTLGLILKAARIEGGVISYFDPDEKPTIDFIFRTSPGYLWSKTKPYTYARIEFDNIDPLEVHIGVRVSGKSKVLHEFDVCVIKQSEGMISRHNQAHPRQTNIVIGVECKFYTTPLALGLAREFLGLGADTTAKNTYFVTNTSSTSVEKLLTARGRNWGSRMHPFSSVDVDRLRSEFQSVFQKYKAINS